MNIFIVGGTGLLGSDAALKFIKLGHKVRTIALELPNIELPKELKIDIANYLNLSDSDLKNYLKDIDVLVFAAGIDDRITGKKPIYNLFKEYNIDPLEKMIKIAIEMGVKKVVILGSYFSYFDKIWPKDKLAINNPYIKSRVDQENMALAYSYYIDIVILELPYIFGTQKGRKPVWTILLKEILNMKGATLYPKGGTTMVTVNQVGDLIVNSSLKNTGTKIYPVGYYNITWKEMLSLFHKGMGINRKIITIPTFLFKLFGKLKDIEYKKQGLEAGLNMSKFSKSFAKEMFIDRSLIKDLDIKEDDIERNIIESVKVSMDAINGKKMIEMKIER